MIKPISEFRTEDITAQFKKPKQQEFVCIMIVDDELINRDILSMYVNSYFEDKDLPVKLQLETAATAAEAIQMYDQLILAEKCPALVFTDYNLEDSKTGIDIACHIKQNQDLKGICLKPIMVLISGQIVQDPDHHFYKMMVKPVTLDMIKRLLNDLVLAKKLQIFDGCPS